MKLTSLCKTVNNVTLCSDPFHLLGVLDTRVEGKCLTQPAKRIFQVVSFFLFLLGALGNIAYIAVTTRTYEELNIVDLFLIGIAVLDFLASIFLPLFYFLEISDYMIHFADGSCKFVAITHELSIVTTVYLLLFAVQAFYKKIVLRRADGRKRTRFLGKVLFSILVSVIPAIPVVIDSRAVDGRCHVYSSSYSYVVIYDTVLFIIQIIIPIFLFTIMFAQLGVHLHLSEAREGDDDPNVALIDHTAKKRKLCLLILVSCTFFLLFVPYVFAHLWFLMDSGRLLEHPFYCYLFDIFHLLICGKCLANPIVYFFYLEGFRENLKRVLWGFRIGRRYNFMHVKYHFRRDNQDGLMEEQGTQMEDGQMLDELGEWHPAQRNATPLSLDPELELDEKDHDYEEDEGQDNVAILRPWKNLRSTST